MSHGVSWLAGFIDGEGTFVLTTRSRGGIAPHIGLTAGNEDNIRAAKAVISEIVGHEVRYRLHHGASHRDRRPFWYIHVQRLDDLKNLCEAILPFAQGKRPNIDVMLRYVAIAPGTDRGDAYLDERLALVGRMRVLNRTFARGQWQALQEELAPAALPREGGKTVRTSERPQVRDVPEETDSCQADVAGRLNEES